MFKLIFYRLTLAFLKFMQLCLFPLEIKGKENIPKKGSFVFASNHRSNLDPMLIPLASGIQMSFMAKDSLFIHPVFGRVITWLGAFPIRRGEGDVSALKESVRRIKLGPLLMFPEGTRTLENPDHQVRAGVGLIVKKGGVPVVPVYIHGSDRAMPPGSKKIKREKVTITFGKPVVFENTLSKEAIAFGVLQKIYELKK